MEMHAGVLISGNAQHSPIVYLMKLVTILELGSAECVLSCVADVTPPRTALLSPTTQCLMVMWQ